MDKEANIFSGGIMSDIDIKSFWGKGINIFSSETGELAFNLEKQLQLGSIDLHFRHEYSKIRLSKNEILTYEMLKQHDYTKPSELKSGEKLHILPGEIIFTTTLETVQFSEEFAGIITGRSSIARLGIMVHCCQEFINPGHGQPIPLQIINLSPCAVELDLRIPICQLVIFKLCSPASGRYKDDINSKYANETGPQPSKIYEEMPEQFSPKTINYIRSQSTIKNVIKKYLLPFFPSIIMLLLVAPFFNNYVNDRSLLDIWGAIQNMPGTVVIGIIVAIIYILIKRGDK